MVDLKKAMRDAAEEKKLVQATDLFSWLDALWTKVRPEGTPPTYMMHRFLASDPDYAVAARELQQYIREPVLVFRVWQGILPRGRGAPRLQYVAAKKAPAEEALVTRMKSVLSVRREHAEQMLALATLAGRKNDLYAEFGIEAPDDE